jgi:hypothetical protein
VGKEDVVRTMIILIGKKRNRRFDLSLFENTMNKEDVVRTMITVVII